MSNIWTKKREDKELCACLYIIAKGHKSPIKGTEKKFENIMTWAIAEYTVSDGIMVYNKNEIVFFQENKIVSNVGDKITYNFSNYFGFVK